MTPKHRSFKSFLFLEDPLKDYFRKRHLKGLRSKGYLYDLFQFYDMIEQEIMLTAGLYMHFQIASCCCCLYKKCIRYSHIVFALINCVFCNVYGVFQPSLFVLIFIEKVAHLIFKKLRPHTYSRLQRRITPPKTYDNN